VKAGAISSVPALGRLGRALISDQRCEELVCRVPVVDQTGSLRLVTGSAIKLSSRPQAVAGPYGLGARSRAGGGTVPTIVSGIAANSAILVCALAAHSGTVVGGAEMRVLSEEQVSGPP
jgi:hypothetical protein